MLVPSESAAASFEAQPGRDVGERSGLAHADELRIRARAEAEDAVADRKLDDGPAHGLDLPRELAAKAIRHAGARSPGEDAAEERIGSAVAGVGAGDRGGAHADEHLVLPRDRRRDFVDAQHLRRPVPVVDAARIDSSCFSVMRLADRPALLPV